MQHRQHARLQPGQVEQVGDQVGEPVERSVGAGEQFPAVRLGPRHVVGAQARHRRLGRGDRRAQVVADRVEQCGAGAFGLGQRLDRTARPRPVRAGGRRPRPARRTRTGCAGRRRTAGARAARGPGVSSISAVPSPSDGLLRRVRPERGEHLPRRVAGARRSRLTLLHPEGLLHAGEQGVAAHRSPRSRLPASADSVSASALARAASAERRADRSTTRETSTATSRKITKRQDVVGVGDRERVERRREVEVQQQAARDRAPQRRPRTRRPGW